MSGADSRPATTLLSIGIVAEHVGMHPQTLREYERQGLVTPQRTPGGTRRYGAAELERLARIQRLTSEGMSLAAVRYVLGLEDESGERSRSRARIARSHCESATRATTSLVGARSHSSSCTSRASARSPRWRNEDCQEARDGEAPRSARRRVVHGRSARRRTDDAGGARRAARSYAHLRSVPRAPRTRGASSTNAEVTWTPNDSPPARARRSPARVRHAEAP